MSLRKIIHVDMDAFYASIEQRDDPGLGGRPVVVAWPGRRSVVCAASYEARRFGIHSAMPAQRAARLCPEAVLVPPDFARYRAVSRQVQDILKGYSDLVEPLSLDEAYLDVTVNQAGRSTATEVARAIRTEIRTRLNLTASAGVSTCKFLAKIASDWCKPDGLFVIRPDEADAFLSGLPLTRLPGVGQVTAQRLVKLGVQTVGALKRLDRTVLEGEFGRFGKRLFELARGIDERPVMPDLPTQSLSAEETFDRDLDLDEMEPAIRRLAGKIWQAAQHETRVAHTTILKLKTDRFRILTRRHSGERPLRSGAEFVQIALSLRQRVGLDPGQVYRLVGVGLGGFREPDASVEQSALFLQD